MRVYYGMKECFSHESTHHHGNKTGRLGCPFARRTGPSYSRGIARESRRPLRQSSIRHIVLSLAELSFMDSSGIGVILGRYKQISARSGEMVVCSINPTIYRIFEMSGLFKVIKFRENEAEALHVLGVA